jgi:hypothetical protein
MQKPAGVLGSGCGQSLAALREPNQIGPFVGRVGRELNPTFSRQVVDQDLDILAGT